MRSMVEGHPPPDETLPKAAVPSTTFGDPPPTTGRKGLSYRPADMP